MLAMTESNCRVPGTEPLTSGISVGVLVPCLSLRLAPTSQTSPLERRQNCWPHFFREKRAFQTFSVRLDGD